MNVVIIFRNVYNVVLFKRDKRGIINFVEVACMRACVRARAYVFYDVTGAVRFDEISSSRDCGWI